VNFRVPSSGNSACEHIQTSRNEAHEKCFHNLSFLEAIMFHGLRVQLMSPRVATFYGGISKVKFSSLSIEPRRNQSRE
jgi:hypothetical protein